MRSRRSTLRPATTLRVLRTLGRLAPVAPLVLLPLALDAQGSGGQRPARVVRTTVNAQRTLNSACAELVASPSPLLQAPEGRAIIRFKKDLEGAAALIERQGDGTARFEIRHMSEVQRDLDSLLQVMVRTMGADSGSRQTVVTLRGQNGDQVHIDARAMRGQVQATIRSMEPRIAAMLEEAGRRTMVRIPAVTGYMGVELSQSVREVPSEAGMLTYFCEYPVVETVTAGSPAEKAGLQAGDTLIAYDGRDLLSNAVNHATLLVPDRVVKVRLKRAGRTRELPVTVQARPRSSAVFVRTQCVPGAACDGRQELSGQLVIRPPLPPLAIVEPMLQGTGLGLLAGARLSVVDRSFADQMGVDPGVLVLGVTAGTPLASAGIRPGEVILAVNGVPLRDMMTLRRAFEAAGSRELKLTVSGKGAAPRIATVRW